MKSKLIFLIGFCQDTFLSQSFNSVAQELLNCINGVDFLFKEDLQAVLHSEVIVLQEVREETQVAVVAKLELIFAELPTTLSCRHHDVKSGLQVAINQG